MNDVVNLFDQQLGFSKWNSYDTMLKRLISRKVDVFECILPDEHVSPPIFACKFAQKQGYEHILALANEDGRLAIHNTEQTAARYGVAAHNNAIFDLAWMPKQTKIISASGDTTVGLFNVSDSTVSLEHVYNGHTRTVKTVACRQNDYSVFATGGRDGNIIVWDSRIGGEDVVRFPDFSIANTHNLPVVTPKRRGGRTDVSAANSVTSLVFQDDVTLISCGAGDGAIKVWDMRKSYSRLKKEPTPKYWLPYAGSKLRNGFSNLTLDPDGLKLYASCLDNVIYCYSLTTYNPQPIMRYVGHKNYTFYVKSSISRDGLYLISGSSDHSAYVWHTGSSYPLTCLSGHQAEVTCVAWRQTAEPVIVTCSDDMRHSVWRLGGETLPDNWHVEGFGTAQEVAPEVDYSTADDGGCKLYNYNKVRTKRCAGPYLNVSKRLRDKVAENEPEPTRKRRNIDDEMCEILSPIDLNVSPTVIKKPATKKIKLDLKLSPPLITDLPNFNVDGSAPHLNDSPVKRADKDWLTKLRLAKELQSKRPTEDGSYSPPKKQRLDCDGDGVTPKRQTRGSANKQSPLLKFFRVTNSRQNGLSKTNNALTSSPKSSSTS